VVGFADSRGTAAYNAALGQRRATAVHGQLSSAIGNLGPPVLQKLKFTVGSEGSKKPIALSSTPQGRARNRRVEVSLLQV
jgi:outer membrane protein OmpA-like peptidoglycan-associated protein